MPVDKRWKNTAIHRGIAGRTDLVWLSHAGDSRPGLVRHSYRVPDGDFWGSAVAAGDFDNDGHCDLVVGTPRKDEAGSPPVSDLQASRMGPIGFGLARGVFSHETALQLHGLSDALPALALTVPSDWTKRRMRVPDALRLRYADLDPREQQVLRGVPVTTPARTVNDCARAFVEPDLVAQAVREGLARKLFTAANVEPARSYVREHGG